MRAILYQTLFATVVWGLFMYFIGGWPRDTIATPMASFALIYGCVLVAWRFLRKQRKAE